ncbi:MAG: nucleotidyltransferase domain-containing protein [Pseudomonadota bacterium]
MTHADAIDTTAAAIRDVPGVNALFLSGSHGNGLADAWSDIDFVLVSDAGATDDLAAAWRAAVAQVGDIVLWWDRTTVPFLINAITADWTRIDLLILKPEQMARHAQSTLKPVFDPGGLYQSLPVATGPQPVNTKRFLYQVEEFIRVLGLLHLVDGREE